MKCAPGASARFFTTSTDQSREAGQRHSASLSLGSNPIRSLTAFLSRCLQPIYRSDVPLSRLDALMTEEVLNLLPRHDTAGRRFAEGQPQR